MRGLVYAVAALPAINAFKISKDGRCGANFGLTCKGSQYGNCCSQYNYCGRSLDYCSPQKGCQSGFGDCSGTAPVPSPPHSVPSKASKDGTCEVSKDGTCGGSKGYTCKNSRFGNCCSRHGRCGSNKDYCGTGCNPLFGSCSGSKPSSFLTSSRTPLPPAPTNAGKPIYITVTSVVTKPTTVALPCEEKTAITTALTTVRATLPQTTITIPGEGEVVTVTVPTTITIPGQSEVTTEFTTETTTLPGTTITIPGEGEVVTVTVPTTITLPGQGEVTTEFTTETTTLPGTTITIPGEGEVVTVTEPTTITVPGQGEATTVTVPTTVTLPGEPITTTVTVPGDAVTTTITVPGEGEVITVTEPTTMTVPGEAVTKTVTVPGDNVVTTVTVPGEAVTTTLTVPGPGVTVTTCAAQNPPSPAVPTQVLVNTGFESTASSSAPWQIVGCTNSAGSSSNPTHTGARDLSCLAYDSNNPDVAYFSLRQTVNLKPGATYQLALWSRADTPEACNFAPASLGGQSVMLSNELWTREWSQNTATFQVPQGMTSSYLLIAGDCFSGTADNGKVYWDDITLTEQISG